MELPRNRLDHALIETSATPITVTLLRWIVWLPAVLSGVTWVIGLMRSGSFGPGFVSMMRAMYAGMMLSAGATRIELHQKALEVWRNRFLATFAPKLKKGNSAPRALPP